MKRIEIIAVTAALLLGLSSCGKAELPEQEGELVSVSLSVNDPALYGKSLYTGGQTTVNEYRVFIYQGGTLAADDYWNGGDPPSFLLPAGTYTFYILCNMGNVPSLGSTPDSWRYSVMSTSAMLSSGLPMAGKQTSLVNAATPSVTVDVTRLVAKYGLYIQRSLNSGETFTVTGVKICQAAADVLPFGSGCTPTSVLSASGGDCATAADLSVLNSSVTCSSLTGPVTFYMLENARGTLLPGNTDPWKKCYDTYGGLLSSANAQICTYIEVSGLWSDGSDSELVYYRCFLGQDNCTNFDVLRNTENTVTLVMTSAGRETASWKIERYSIF